MKELWECARHATTLVPTCVCLTLTCDRLDVVRHIQIATGSQSSEEGCHVVGVLEALGGLLVALPVVYLQVHHRADGKQR